MSEVDNQDVNKLQRALDDLFGPGLLKFKGRLTWFVAAAIKQVIRPYPGPSHSPVIWPSDKARRYYFAMRRKDNLPLKYTRLTDPWSKQIQNNWTIQRDNTSATLGNRASSAPWVVSDEFQTEQHEATGWTTDKQAAEQVMTDGTMDKIINAQIKAMVDNAFKGLR